MADKLLYFTSVSKSDYTRIRKCTWKSAALDGRGYRWFQLLPIFSFYDMESFFLVKPGTAVNKKKTCPGSAFRGLFQLCFPFSPSGSQGCWNLCWRDPLSSSVNLSASSCWIGKGCIVTTCYSSFMPVCLSSLQHKESLFWSM